MSITRNPSHGESFGACAARHISLRLIPIALSENPLRLRGLVTCFTTRFSRGFDARLLAATTRLCYCACRRSQSWFPLQHVFRHFLSGPFRSVLSIGARLECSARINTTIATNLSTEISSYSLSEFGFARSDRPIDRSFVRFEHRFGKLRNTEMKTEATQARSEVL